MFHHKPMKSTTAPVSCQPLTLATYLTGLVGGSFLIAAPQAEAAVTAVTFGFGSEYTSTDGSNNTWSVDPGQGTLIGYANASATHLWLGYNPASRYGSVYHNGSFSGLRGLPTFFANGTVIGLGGNGSIGLAYFQNSMNPSRGDFTSDQLNKNIAFITSTHKWGWANVSWTEATSTLVINSAYVESIANAPITVGDTGISAAPEPSRALLALAGLGGVALRRRRKQA